MLGSELLVTSGPIQAEEVKEAVQRLKNGKAATDVAAEFLKAAMSSESSGWRLIVELMQSCWEKNTIPSTWHLAKVAMVF